MKYHENERFIILENLLCCISHEIKNPLSGISGPVDNLMELYSRKKGGLNKTEKKYFDFIDHSMSKIMELINRIDLFTLNKKIEKKEILLKPVIEQVIGSIKMDLKKQISFDYNIDKKLKVMANRTALSSILKNILTNSIDAVKDRGKISVTVSRDEKEIRIKDNGRGISTQNLKRIFDPYYTSKKDVSGSGLGLFIVKDFAYKMDWGVEVESKVNEGTVFKLYVNE
jgi:signal transduction histidine kinase